MAARELSALFDMVKHHVELVAFRPGEGPGYDLYSGRGRKRWAAALEVLQANGLAHPVEWAEGVIYYRLDDEARAALGG